MMFSNNAHMSGWYVGLMIVGMLALLAVLVIIAAWLIRSGGPTRVVSSSTPQRLLAGRFASGEISEPEYSARLATLQNRDPGPR